MKCFRCGETIIPTAEWFSAHPHATGGVWFLPPQEDHTAEGAEEDWKREPADSADIRWNPDFKSMAQQMAEGMERLKRQHADRERPR